MICDEDRFLRYRGMSAERLSREAHAVMRRALESGRWYEANDTLTALRQLRERLGA